MDAIQAQYAQEHVAYLLNNVPREPGVIEGYCLVRSSAFGTYNRSFLAILPVGLWIKKYGKPAIVLS